jgi:predicted RNase H-like nuclease (RuvC/YqgF family)
MTFSPLARSAMESEAAIAESNRLRNSPPKIDNIHELKKQIEALTFENHLFKGEIINQECQIKRLKANVEDLTNENTSLLSTIANQRQRIEDLETKYIKQS